MAWKHRTIAQELEIVHLSKDHCRREIAEKLGMSRWTVGVVQRKYHIVLRFGQSYHSAEFRHRWDENKWGLVLEELYGKQRLSLEEVARRCHVHKGTVRRRLVALGFEIRTAGETLQGKSRKPYKYNVDYPVCGCGTRIMTPGEKYCATCRRRPTQISHYAH